MKNILLTILLTIMGCFAFGQSYTDGTDTYRFEISGHIYGTSGSDCGNNITRGLQWIAIKKENNEYVTIVQGSSAYPNKGNGLVNTDYHATYDFTKKNKVTRIMYSTIYRGTTAIGFCKSSRNTQKQHSLNVCDVVNYNYDGLNQSGYSTETIKPIVTLNAPIDNNRNLSNEENLIITLPGNMDNQYYNWEYSVGNTTNFIPFPSQYNKVPVLNLKGKEFLSNDDFGKTIYIRVNTGCTYSNIISFSYKKSAPHITSHSTSNTKCFDTADGSITLKFDRTLEVGETLKIILENTETKAAVRLPNNGYITDNLQSNTTYTLQNLPAGKYKLNLVGDYNGNNTYTGGEKHSFEFEIKKAIPVTFEKTSHTDVYCFGGNDGVINIEAKGGTSSYQYSVTKDGQPFLDWTDFNNGENTSIENLPKGIYKIKVRDTNECVAKDPNDSSIEKEMLITITQPDAPIALPESDIEIFRPTGYGLSNGYISVRVTGGTHKADGSYNFEWRKDSPAAWGNSS